MPSVVGLLNDSLLLMRSGNSLQIYVVPHLKSLITKRKEGYRKKKDTMRAYYFPSRAHRGLPCWWLAEFLAGAPTLCRSRLCPGGPGMIASRQNWFMVFPVQRPQLPVWGRAAADPPPRAPRYILQVDRAKDNLIVIDKSASFDRYLI